jgi:hypothetical protein
MGQGNLPAVQIFTGDSVPFASEYGQKPKPLLSWRVVTQTGHESVGIWPGWNRTVVSTFWFLQL